MKRLSIVFVVLVLPYFILPSFAQFGEDTVQQELSPRKKKRMGKKLVKRNSYYNALDYYEEYYKAKPDKTETLETLAELNYLLRDYKMAEKWYKVMLDDHPEQFPKARYWYALMQKYNAKYDEAIENFTIFIDRYLADDSEKFHQMASKHIEGANLAKNLMDSPVRVEIEHLDEDINNPFSDYSASFFGKDKLYFSSIRSDSALDVMALKGKAYHSKIFVSNLSEEGEEWQKAEPLPLDGNINDPKRHVGNGSFSPDFNRIYFTKCKQKKRTLKTDCCIFVAKRSGDKWGEPVELSKDVINLKKSTNTHPFLATNEAGQEILYFASDREGGIGGMDLWYAISTGKNEFDEPVNLGPTINTEGDEKTPFYDIKNKKLYFSSDGHVNIGGFDVYVAEGSESQWNNPVNVGYPLNSSTDDMYYTIDENEEEGFFVSNRPGGFSLKSETCCDDIYQYDIIKEIVMDAYVASKTDPEVPLADVDVSFFTVHGDELVLISNFKTGELEHFVVPMDPETVYQVNATKTGYWGAEEVLDMTQIEVDDTLFQVFLIEEIARRKIKLKRIYYNFDRYNITREYKNTLDSLYTILVENDSFTLEIIGHTDHIGTDKYNMELSRKRAESAADYLMQKGIDKDRLTLIAKGESEPIAPNDKENGADNPKGRAKNRRVGFKLNTNDPYLEIDIEYVDVDPAKLVD